MHRIRTAVAIASAALVVPLAACVAGPPAPSPQPAPVADSIVSVLATQTAGPLGDGTEGMERTDEASLAAVADVLAMEATPNEDIQCYWSTRTTVEVELVDGTTDTIQTDSCGATGRDEALGLLVAEWVLDEA